MSLRKSLSVSVFSFGSASSSSASSGLLWMYASEHRGYFRDCEDADSISSSVRAYLQM